MKTILLTLLTLFLFSCSTENREELTETPTLLGKWYFEEVTHCGRNSMEFKQSNLFIENHFNGNCINSQYQSSYTLNNNQITFNNSTKTIIELTNNELILYDEEFENYYYYTRN